MAVVETNITFTITKTLPAGAPSGYSLNALHLEVIYPDKTVKWIEASEIVASEFSLAFDDSTAEGADPIADPAKAGAIAVGYIPTVAGKHRITVYAGAENGNYTKVGSKSITVVTAGSQKAKTVITVQKDTQYVPYDIDQSQTF